MVNTPVDSTTYLGDVEVVEVVEVEVEMEVEVEAKG